MTRYKTVFLSVFALAALLVAVPSAVMAAHPSAKKPVTWHVYGSLESLTPTQAVIGTRRGNITVALKPVVAYVSWDQAAAIAGIKTGDQVDAFGNFVDGTLHADRIRYDTVPFVISKLDRFEGTYSASTAGTLTLQLTRKRAITFAVDAHTRYFQHGKPLSGPPTYTAGESVAVWARDYSNQVWLASRVNVKP